MFMPPPTEPMTPEGWKVLGCVVLAIGFGIAAFGIYGLVALGLGSVEAWRVLCLGVAVIGAVALIGYLVRRWVGWDRHPASGADVG